jgi:hypothetical protein
MLNMVIFVQPHGAMLSITAGLGKQSILDSIRLELGEDFPDYLGGAGQG